MDNKQFVRIAKALADPRRLEILEVIAGEREMSCGAIAERFPVGQSTISHHLRVLADAGLIEMRREGQHGFSRTDPTVLDAYIEELRRRMIACRSTPPPKD